MKMILKGEGMAQLIKRSVLAGMLVGIGVVIHTVSEDKRLGALLFSFALLTIIKCELKLYTGKIGFFQNETPKSLLLMLLFNLAGSLIPTLGVALARPAVREAVETASRTKFGNSFAALFLYGALCGVLMFVAVYAKDTVITIFCIMIFILSGYEHCIADAVFLALGFSAENCVKFAGIVLGNSAGSIAAAFLAARQKD